MMMEKLRQLAADAALAGEVPVAAALVQADGTLLAESANRVMRDKDPTAHAEMLVIRAAAQKLKDERLWDCTLYVTLEPCTMCAAAISHARLKKVVFGAYDAKGGGVEHGARFYQQPTCHHIPEVVGGVDETACAAQLRDFFAQKR